MNDSDLHRLLVDLLASGTTGNVALERLLDDYTRSHVVMVVLSGVCAIAGMVAAAVAGRRSSRRAALVDAAFAIGALVLTIANLSNALNPRRGFAGAVDMLPTARSGTRTAEVQQAFAEWLRAGRGGTPAVVREAVEHRLSWQRPKAAVSAVLLVAGIAATRRTRRRPLRATGGAICVLLVVMVIGNSQGCFAPLTRTLLGA